MLQVSHGECDSTGAQSQQDTQNVTIEEYNLQGAVPRFAKEPEERQLDSLVHEPISNTLKSMGDRDEYEEDYVLQKLSMLQLRLEEATKTLQVERE